MPSGAKGGLALVGASVLIAIVAPIGVASAASLTVHAPSKINRTTRFNVAVSGTANFANNYLALFVSPRNCKSTFAAENSGAGRLLRGLFVGRTFNVTMLKNAAGGTPVTLWFCAYLYPKASGSAWAAQPPEVLNSHKITFT
jgi:hypothetical protein